MINKMKKYCRLKVRAKSSFGKTFFPQKNTCFQDLLQAVVNEDNSDEQNRGPSGKDLLCRQLGGLTG
jgi:hypothetical protein